MKDKVRGMTLIFPFDVDNNMQEEFVSLISKREYNILPDSLDLVLFTWSKQSDWVDKEEEEEEDANETKFIVVSKEGKEFHIDVDELAKFAADKRTRVFVQTCPDIDYQWANVGVFDWHRGVWNTGEDRYLEKEGEATFAEQVLLKSLCIISRINERDRESKELWWETKTDK